VSKGLRIAALSLAIASVSALHAADWTHNMAFTQWSGSNDADRYYTTTPESCEARAALIADAGYTAVILSGYHFRLNFLDRDEDLRRTVAFITEACHRHGLKVIEHIDLTVHYYDGYPLVFEHPDWLQVHAADMMTRHRIYCPNNPDFQRFYLDYVRRFQQDTNIDAWQMDEVQWLGRGYCGCRHCRAKWQQDMGRPYPAVEAPGFFDRALEAPEYRDWMRWRGKALNDFRRLVREELQAIRPDVKLFKYTTADQASPFVWTRGSDYETTMTVVDTVGTEINPVPFDGYVNLQEQLTCRRALSEASGRAAWAKFDITIPSAYFCWAFGRMQRQSLWWSLNPENDDPRPADLLNWPWQMDDAAASTDADVGVLLSKSTRDLRYDQNYFAVEFHGWLQSLLLAPQDVKVLLESQLLADPRQLDRLRLLVLPNCTSIAPAQAEALLTWVRSGGRLIMTVDSGTLDANGEPAPDPFIAHAGVAITDRATGTVKLSLAPEGEYEVDYRHISTAPNSTVIATMAVDGKTLPLLTSRREGEGSIHYVAAKLGAPAYEDRQLSSHYRKDGFRPAADARAIDMIQGIAARVLGDAPVFRLTGAPRGLIASVYRTEHDGRPVRAIHLLNCSGRSLSEGDPVEFDKDNPPSTPELPDLRLHLPGTVSEALLASPELTEPLPISATNDAQGAVLPVPAASFATYGVIWAYD